jgi:hypothetical protein
MLFAVLVLAERPLGLRDVHLHKPCITSHLISLPEPELTREPCMSDRHYPCYCKTHHLAEAFSQSQVKLSNYATAAWSL